VHEFFLNYFTLLKIRCFLGFAAIPRRGVEGSLCQKTEANSKPPESDPIRLCPRQSKVYLAALIKEKVTSLKENRADNAKREVAWNQERNVGFGWGSAVRAVT
jgi:hypothetical protein